MKPCSDPFCPQFCQLLSSFLITVSDISDAVRKRLVDFGLVSSLLRALNTLKKAKIDDVSQSIEEVRQEVKARGGAIIKIKIAK